MIQRYKAHIGLGHFQMCFDEDVAKLEADLSIAKLEKDRLNKILFDLQLFLTVDKDVNINTNEIYRNIYKWLKKALEE